MPWLVDQCDGCPPTEPWCVTVEATGEIVGCHETKADAADQVAALNANEADADEVEAADIVEESRADELPAMEQAMGRFADEYRRRMADAESLGLIAPIWEQLAFESLAEPFAHEATAQTIAVAVASGYDPATIPQTDADRLAHQHLQGFADYGNLLAAVVATAQQKPVTAAGTNPDDPTLEIVAGTAAAATVAAVDPYLTEQRLGTIVERITVAMRNGATDLAMNTTTRTLAASQRSALPAALAAALPEPDEDLFRESRCDRFKKWMTVLDG